MTTGLAFDVESLANTVTKSVIAFLTLIGVVLVVLGLGRAWAGRRRTQVVLEDIHPLEGIPASAVAGLSPQLRQVVRRALTTQGLDASYAHLRTLARDVDVGLLVTARGTTVEAVTTELHATTRDSLSALSAGVRAVAPKEADGLLAVLSASLPAQRGCVVRTFPTLRAAGTHSEVGLTLEFAELGDAPHAVTSFWSSAPVAGNDAERAASAHSALSDLLEPASLWIAIRLVARHLAPTGRLDKRILDLHRRRRTELLGLRLQLAGQMSLYATRKNEKFERCFADQALDDLAAAERLLPHYFRPVSTRAQVHERVGWSHRRAASTGPARGAFIDAIGEYDRADALLGTPADLVAPGPFKDEREALHLRRTKCRLLSGDIAQFMLARRELQTMTDLREGTPIALYNAACLMAVALASEVDWDGQASVWERRAWDLLGRSLLVGGDEGPWNRVMSDIELQSLDPVLRSRFCDELKSRNPSMAKLADVRARALVDEVLGVLAIVQPPER
jgi:hypothetical protein